MSKLPDSSDEKAASEYWGVIDYDGDPMRVQGLVCDAFLSGAKYKEAVMRKDSTIAITAWAEECYKRDEAIEVMREALCKLIEKDDHHWSRGYVSEYSDSDENTDCTCGIAQARRAITKADEI